MATQVSDRPATTTHDRVIVLKSAEETAGEFFRCEYIALAVSPPPRDHINTHQEERLEVVEGTVRCRVAGKGVRPGAGQGDGDSRGDAARRLERRPQRLALDFRIPPRDERPGNVPRLHRQPMKPTDRYPHSRSFRSLGELGAAGLFQGIQAFGD